MSSSTTIAQAFDSFRTDLDDYNDRRERLIKASNSIASRDVTNLSKKVIFHLHRMMLEDSSDERSAYARAAASGREKLKEVQKIYADIKHEVEGGRFWRHDRQVSPGLQEYIEALSFAYYLEHKSLIPFKEVQNTLRDDEGEVMGLHGTERTVLSLTPYDYLLGISDLTGELMRFAISAVSRRGGRTKAQEVCMFVRNCKADLERMTPYIYDLQKKQHVTTQSLEKIEDAMYAIVVRSSEYELPPEMLDDIVAQSVSRYGRGAHESEDSRVNVIF